MTEKKRTQPVGHNRRKARAWHSQGVDPLKGSSRESPSLAKSSATHSHTEEDSERLRCWFERIAQTTPDIIFVLDIVDNRNIYTNRSILETLGYSSEEFGKLTDPLKEVIAPDDLLETQEFYRNFADAEPGQVRLLRHRARHKDGTIRWIENRVTPFTWDENGNLREVIGLAHDITERKRMELAQAQLLEEVSEHREHLRALTAQLVEAQEAERKAMARELHDQMGQNLTALDLNLNIIQEQIAASSQINESVQTYLNDSLAIVEHVGNRIRDIMAELRPPMLDDYGLLATLGWYGSQLASRTDFAVTVLGEEPAPRLPAPVELALFRITQEALTNVTRHAQASQVTIKLGSHQDAVRLIVADNGLGFENKGHKGLNNQQSWGLITMTERAEAVGGQCRIESQPGQGTQVIVEITRAQAGME